LQAALETEGVERRVALTLPGFLGLSAILGSTDLVATLPRHTAETLAAAARLQVLPCPFAVPGFQVKQYWHARRETDQGGAWLRDACWQLFGR
jgi:DNA-binding transcriptional LysR family regulator